VQDLTGRHRVPNRVRPSSPRLVIHPARIETQVEVHRVPVDVRMAGAEVGRTILAPAPRVAAELAEAPGPTVAVERAGGRAATVHPVTLADRRTGD
jgi:hypothetical protein